MTREKAINQLKDFIILYRGDHGWDVSTLDALDMAVKALEQTEPERKTGKIICSNEEINCGNIIGHVLRCKCSECNFVIDRYEAKFINYCPNCGTKMEV